MTKDRSQVGGALTEALRRALPGAGVFGDDPRVGAGFVTWNARTAHPLARVECRSVEHVQKALRLAGEFTVPVAVSGGRHDAFARTNRDGHLILDLRWMAGVCRDAVEKTVTVQGGVTTRALLAALPEDIVTVTGSNAEVGVAGLTLGGGYGSLNGRFGLACDVLLGAQVVLADGKVVDASRSGDAELYWALRGGGTGFGVVTSLTLATYQLPSVLKATFFFPLPTAKSALLAAQELLDLEPDLLSLMPLFTTGLDGERGLHLALLWSGEPRRGKQILHILASCAGARVLSQNWVLYRETLDPPEMWPWGRRWEVDTRTIGRLDEAMAEGLVDAAGRMTSPRAVIFLHDFHGVASRVAVGATAFPLRENHFVVGIVSSWAPDDKHEVDAQQTWMRETSARLTAEAYPGGYVNFLPPEQGERVRLFYGASADRLRRIKRRVDPEGVFRASTGYFDTEDAPPPSPGRPMPLPSCRTLPI